MNENSADDRQLLLEQFLRDISSGSSAVFYEEDDLLEIYDYASDIGDGYAKFEALLCGLRLYPASVRLGERKVLFLISKGDTEAAKAALQGLPDSSVIKKLLSLLLIDKKESTFRQSLDRILSDVKEFEDEEVIQLVKIASSLDEYSWLKENYSAIRAKCGYQPSFLFELMVTADYREDYPTVIKVLEELTLLEPFNEEYWEKLAEVHIMRTMEIEKGLSYLDYALAINPRSVQALLLKARALFELEKPTEDVLKVLEQARQIEPENSSVAQYSAICLYGRGYNLEALEQLYDYNKLYPTNLDVVENILVFSDGQLKRDILAPFFNTDNKYSEEIIYLLDLAKRLKMEGAFTSALSIFEYYDNKFGLEEEWEQLMELYYRTGRFGTAVEKWHKLQDKERSQVTDLIYVLSCIRVNRWDLVDRDIHEIINRWVHTDTAMSYSTLAYRLGVMYILTMISQSREDGESIDIDEYDPFIQPD